MRRRPPLRVVAVAAVVALAVSSCLSPTLPLPPPERPDTIQPGTSGGTWDVFGHCDPGAIVTVINEKTGLGVVVEDRSRSGSYHVLLKGAQCDLASVSEELLGDESARTTFVLAAHMSGDPTDNPLCH